MAARALIVEDTPSLALTCRAMARAAGWESARAGSIDEARAALARNEPALILLDLMLLDGCGLEFLREVGTTHPSVPVVVIAANGSIGPAVSAMRSGAHDYLLNPVREDRLTAASAGARKAADGTSRTAAVAAEASGISGDSAAIRELRAAIARVAPSMATTFITGETGTGKELCARAIHAASPRAARPFVTVDCAAIPEELMESEMFGHRRGAFTGAVSDQTGAAARADGGTLFLDEVCELSRPVQGRLLRFLDSGQVQPLGAGAPRKVDVRILCASNRDPLAAVRAGDFREDLYYRLHVVPVAMPPLRDRGDDVIDIAEAALTRIAAEEGRDVVDLSGCAKSALRRHDWPGNVRELLNLLRRIVVLSDGGEVTEATLPAAMRSSPEHSATPSSPAKGALGVKDLVDLPLEDVERRVIEATIARAGGSVPQAARSLGIAPSTLYRKRARWGDNRREAV